jgi:hypothetical protein
VPRSLKCVNAPLLILVSLLGGVSRSWAAGTDQCSADSTVSDVKLALTLKNDQQVFRQGEIIPLILTFTASTKNRYWADVRNYDRSGRLSIEHYCLEPEAPDPLDSYFKSSGGFIGGGLGSTRALDDTAFTAEAELNEWRTLEPGHYRLYAVSYRVWRPPDPKEKTPYGRVSEVVRSNTVEFDVVAASPEWQTENVRTATQTLAGSSSPDESRHAARVLRFLNSSESTQQIAKLFWGLNQQQPVGWDLMFGLYGSPYRQVAIQAMHEEFAVPEHAITSEFLQTLVNLEISGDSSWDPPDFDPEHPQILQSFRDGRQAHARELMTAEIQQLNAVLPQKVGTARALTLNGLIADGGGNPALIQAIRPALISAWQDLPPETQRELIQYRWPLIDDPGMLPILRRLVAEPPPPARTDLAMARDAALKHIYELNPDEGRTLILRDLQDVHAHPGIEVVRLLPPEDITAALPATIERIARNDARELDYQLLDKYGQPSALGTLEPAFEERLGKWACAPQAAMLRYVLRVDAAYGAEQVRASMNSRKDTHCYSQLFQSLGDELPAAQESAITALNDSDPEVTQDAVIALGRWGSSEAETPLWSRLERFHKEWTGREGELRITPDYQSPGSRGAALEQALVRAIAAGTGWICPPDKLERLNNLSWMEAQKRQIESWIKQWNSGPARISSPWFPEDSPPFSVLQYDGMTEEQLRTKLGQLPRGTQLLWQFWQPRQISPPVSMEKQEAAYERIRTLAQSYGITLTPLNHP